MTTSQIWAFAAFAVVLAAVGFLMQPASRKRDERKPEHSDSDANTPSMLPIQTATGGARGTESGKADEDSAGESDSSGADGGD